MGDQTIARPLASQNDTGEGNERREHLWHDRETARGFSIRQAT